MDKHGKIHRLRRLKKISVCSAGVLCMLSPLVVNQSVAQAVKAKENMVSSAQHFQPTFEKVTEENQSHPLSQNVQLSFVSSIDESKEQIINHDTTSQSPQLNISNEEIGDSEAQLTAHINKKEAGTEEAPTKDETTTEDATTQESSEQKASEEVPKNEENEGKTSEETHPSVPNQSQKESNKKEPPKETPHKEEIPKTKPDSEHKENKTPTDKKTPQETTPSNEKPTPAPQPPNEGGGGGGSAPANETQPIPNYPQQQGTEGLNQNNQNQSFKPVESTVLPSNHYGESTYQHYVNLVNNSYKYNPLLIEELTRLSRSGQIHEGDVQGLGRKEQFDNNQYLNALQKNSDYFRFQYFNPLTSKQYYDRLDQQVLALITRQIGSMPELKAQSNTAVENKNQQDKIEKIEQHGENLNHQSMHGDTNTPQKAMSYKPMIYIGVVLVGFVVMISMILWKRLYQFWK